MLNLPDISFQLPEWEERHFEILRRAEKKLSGIARKAGKGSDEFKKSCRRLLEGASRSQKSNIQNYIKSTVDVRAFTYLLSSEEEFANQITVDKALLEHLSKIRSPLSRITLTQLIRAFLVRFDLVATEKHLKTWGDFIKHELVRFQSMDSTSELKTYANNRDLIFLPYGPSHIVKYAQKENIDFDGIIKRFALTGFTDGRFLTLCRFQYYLETLKSLKVGQDHPVLTEICNKDVVNSPYTAEKQLGHVILEFLIDKSAGKAISHEWQKTILTIAGDPRVPKTSPNYQQWWSLLGDKRIALMCGWLSRFDLKLFLEVLEQSAKDASNSDMSRMFRTRKVFMEGLLNSGQVTESRLFLSDYAERYLKRHYRKKELPEYARVSSRQTSMIYLNIAGRVHMIEGSHSFKLKLMDRLPAKSSVSNYEVRTINDSELRTTIALQHRNEFNYGEGICELVHDVHFNWQHKAIFFLKSKGVKIAAGDVISKDSYRYYKSKHGVN